MKKSILCSQAKRFTAVVYIHRVDVIHGFAVSLDPADAEEGVSVWNVSRHADWHEGERGFGRPLLSL